MMRSSGYKEARDELFGTGLVQHIDTNEEGHSCHNFDDLDDRPPAMITSVSRLEANDIVVRQHGMTTDG